MSAAGAFDAVIVDASEVLTCDGPEGAPPELLLQPIPKGAIGIRGGKVAWLGPERELPAGAVGERTHRVSARGGFVGPGFVDCHTHLVFAGDRSDEFEARCQGKSYLEIAAAGGGIVRTVDATRAAGADRLVELALPRCAALLAQGVTTAEVKSGYGLDADTELEILRVVQRLGERQPLTLVPTYLGLHALPREYAARRADYVALCTDVVLPQVAAAGLARFADAFVERTAFTAGEARTFLTRAKALGLGVRLHVDQLTEGQGGAELAAALGAVSADHLERVSADGVQALARAGVVAVLAPTSTLFARARPFASGRALRDAGVAVAVCTNLNPGSSLSENVALALGLACLECGLTPAEAYLGFTRYAGQALREPGAGRLAVGFPADLALFAAESYRQLPYRFAVSQVHTVVKGGRAFDFERAPRQTLL